MNRFVFALTIFLLSSLAIAAETKIEESYSADTITQADISTVDQLIAYSSKEHSNLKSVNSDSILFLKNGQRVELSSNEKNEAIASAKTVQVMGSESSLVINVITL